MDLDETLDRLEREVLRLEEAARAGLGNGGEQVDVEELRGLVENSRLYLLEVDSITQDAAQRPDQQPSFLSSSTVESPIGNGQSESLGQGGVAASKPTVSPGLFGVVSGCGPVGATAAERQGEGAGGEGGGSQKSKGVSVDASPDAGDAAENKSSSAAPAADQSHGSRLRDLLSTAPRGLGHAGGGDKYSHSPREVSQALTEADTQELSCLLSDLLLGLPVEALETGIPETSSSASRSHSQPVAAAAAATAAAAASVAAGRDSWATGVSSSRRSTLLNLTAALDGSEEEVEVQGREGDGGRGGVAKAVADSLIHLVPSLLLLPPTVLDQVAIILGTACMQAGPSRVESLASVLAEALVGAQKLASVSPEAVTNLANLVGCLTLLASPSSYDHSADFKDFESASGEGTGESYPMSSSGPVNLVHPLEGMIGVKQSDGDEEDGLLHVDEAIQKDLGSALDQVCTYTKTSNTFSEQHWYHCWTCNLAFQEGCCAVCARTCHKGHDVTYSRYSRFFCDCGAAKRASNPCLALAPQKAPQPSVRSGHSSPAASAATSPARASAAASPPRALAGRKHSLTEENIGGGGADSGSGWVVEWGRRAIVKIGKDSRADLVSCFQRVGMPSLLSSLYKQIVLSMEARVFIRPPALFSLSDLGSVVNVTGIPPLMLRRSMRHITAQQAATNISLSSSTTSATMHHGPSLMCLTREGLVVMCECEQLLVIDAKRRLLDTAGSPIVDKKPPPKPLAAATLPFTASKLVQNPTQPSQVLILGGKHCSAYLFAEQAKHMSVVHVPVGGEDVVDATWLPESSDVVAISTPSCLRLFDLSMQPPAVTHTVTLPNAASINRLTVATSLHLPPSPHASFSSSSSMSSHVWAFMVGSDGRVYQQCLGRRVDGQGLVLDGGSGSIEVAATCDGLNEGGAESAVSIYWSWRFQLLYVGYSDGSVGLARLREEDEGESEVVGMLSRPQSALDVGSIVPGVVPASSSSLPRHFEVVGELDDWGMFVVCCSDGRGSWGVLSVGQGSILVSLMPASTSSRLTGVAAVRGWCDSSYTSVSLVASTSDGYLHHYALADPTAAAAAAADIDAQRANAASSPSPSPASRSAIGGGGLVMQHRLSSAVFEKCVCITGRMRLSGELVTARVPSSRDEASRVKPNAATADTLISANPNQLRIHIQNSNSEFCIIGVLVLVGDVFPSQIPTEIQIQGRVAETHEGVKRWYALVLTPDEILQSDREFAISTTGSHTAGLPPAIDKIEVFGMRKDLYGWDEKIRRAADRAGQRGRTNRETPTTGAGPTLEEDAWLRAAACCLWSTAAHSTRGHQAARGGDDSEQDGEAKVWREWFVSELPRVLLRARPASLGPSLKQLVASFFPSRFEYLEVKDKALVGGIMALIEPASRSHTALAQLISPCLLSSIASYLERLSMRRPDYMAGVIAAYPWALKAHMSCLHALASALGQREELETAATALIHTLISISAALIPSQHSASYPETVDSCIELLRQGLLSPHAWMRKLFSSKLADSLVVVDEALPLSDAGQARLVSGGEVSQAHQSVKIGGEEAAIGSEGLEAHDHMDASRCGPLFWEECLIPEGGIEADGSSIVYCCDVCGEQPVVGRRFHCRVCHDFDLCHSCYVSIEDGEPAAPLWLYPPSVDPSDEETLLKMAINLSLEQEHPVSIETLRSLFLRSLCNGLGAVFSLGRDRCIAYLDLIGTLSKQFGKRDEAFDGRDDAARSITSTLSHRPALTLTSATSTVEMQAHAACITLLSSMARGLEHRQAKTRPALSVEQALAISASGASTSATPLSSAIGSGPLAAPSHLASPSSTFWRELSSDAMLRYMDRVLGLAISLWECDSTLAEGGEPHMATQDATALAQSSQSCAQVLVNPPRPQRADD